MLYFYKDYNSVSKLATVISSIGGIFYAGAVIFILTFLIDSGSMGIEELLFGVVFCLVMGVGLNKLAEFIAIKKKNKMEKNTTADWKCPKCGTLNDGKFCSECGSAKIIKKYCPNCGHQVDANQKFCGNCGKNL